MGGSKRKKVILDKKGIEKAMKGIAR